MNSYPYKLQEGQAFEKWICQKANWVRRTEDQHQGDTVCNREIKLDCRWQQSSNLLIETEETPHEGGRWHKASIFTGAKFLVQGNYECVWEFEAWVIKDLVDRVTVPFPMTEPKQIERWPPTVVPEFKPDIWKCTTRSYGFKLPLTIADQIACRVLNDRRKKP